MADAPLDQPRFCSRCGQPIVVADASFCKQCGAALPRNSAGWRGGGFSPAAALALSIIPGLGQLYRGKPFRGVLWFFGVSFAYALGTPLGMLIHMICAANAAFAGPAGTDAIAGPPAR